MKHKKHWAKVVSMLRQILPCFPNIKTSLCHSYLLVFQIYQTRNIDPMLVQCCTSVFNVGTPFKIEPTLDPFLVFAGFSDPDIDCRSIYSAHSCMCSVVLAADLMTPLSFLRSNYRLDLTLRALTWEIEIFSHLKLRLATAIHNFQMTENLCYL